MPNGKQIIRFMLEQLLVERFLLWLHQCQVSGQVCFEFGTANSSGSNRFLFGSDLEHRTC